MAVYLRKLKKNKTLSVFFNRSNYHFYLLTNKLILQLFDVLLGDFLYKILSFNSITYFAEFGQTLVFVLYNAFFKYLTDFKKVFDLVLKRKGYYFELDLQGLGFDIVRISKSLFRIFWGHASYLYILLKKNVVMFSTSQKKKQLFLFGINKSSIYGYVALLCILKGFSSYSMVGFYNSRVLVRLRSGKRK